MADLRVLVPEDTINYIQNPSMRFDTTGYVAVNSTISRTLNYSRFGIGALKIITNGSQLREGFYYRVNTLSGINSPITVSAYVRGTGKVRIRLIDNPAGPEWYSKTITLSEKKWSRVFVTGRCSGSNDMRLYIETNGSNSQAVTFYADGMQMEKKAFPTTYCDGDQPGCRWNIIKHASNSSRTSETRLGGKWISLTGKDAIDPNLYMTVMGGMGMPSIQNNSQSFALSPGSSFQNAKILSKVVTYSFHAKQKSTILPPKEISFSPIHSLRQLVIDIFKPDLTKGDEEFLVEYTEGDKSVYFRARYDGGLEGDWDIRNKWINSFPLRLFCSDPFFFEDDQEVFDIDFQDSLRLSGIAGKMNNIWSNMNYGINSSGADLEVGKNGEIYLSGSFTLANNNSQAIDPLIPANRITYWDGEKFNKLTVGTNGAINDVAVAPNGDVYVTGSFTSAGGVATNKIAKYSISTQTWSALGSGLNGDGVHISIAPNGDVYVGGGFTTAGGVTAEKIAKWDGIAWYPIGQYKGLNNTVQSIAISPDGSFMYVGGNFTDQAGLSANAIKYIAKYTVSTNTFVQVGDGFTTGNCTEVLISPSGVLYACGDFTISGTTTVNRICQLIGNSLSPLGSGANATINSMDISPNGDLIAVGSFTIIGGINAKGVALWNGTSWTNLDIELSIGTTTPTLTMLSALFAPNGDLYIGGQGTSVNVTHCSAITNVENTGSSECSPEVYILGPGRLKWLENITTKKRVFFDLTVLNGEEVFIDFGKGTIKSTIRGDLFYSVLPGSDFKAFTLRPGSNRIACLMTSDVNAIMKMWYTPSHWSADAIKRTESV